MVLSINDKQLSAELVSQSFTSIFKEHFDCLYNYGIKITGRSDIVEDSIQEVFYRIWKNKIDLDGIINIKSYLLKAVRRQILNLLELKSNHHTIELTENLQMEFSQEDFIILQQEETSVREKVLVLLNKLPSKQKEAIYLRFFEDICYEEVAAIMNIRMQSAKNHVSRGIESLRTLVKLWLFMELIIKS